MPIEVNIKPEDIDALVKNAVLTAGLGNSIQKALKTLFEGYNNPCEGALKSYVHDLIREMLRTEFGDTLRQKVREVLTKTLTEDVLDKIMNKAVSDMCSAIKDY